MRGDNGDAGAQRKFSPSSECSLPHIARNISILFSGSRARENEMRARTTWRPRRLLGFGGAPGGRPCGHRAGLEGRQGCHRGRIAGSQSPIPNGEDGIASGVRQHFGDHFASSAQRGGRLANGSHSLTPSSQLLRRRPTQYLVDIKSGWLITNEVSVRPTLLRLTNSPFGQNAAFTSFQSA